MQVHSKTLRGRDLQLSIEWEAQGHPGSNIIRYTYTSSWPLQQSAIRFYAGLEPYLKFPNLSSLMPLYARGWNWKTPYPPKSGMFFPPSHVFLESNHRLSAAITPDNVLVIPQNFTNDRRWQPTTMAGFQDGGTTPHIDTPPYYISNSAVLPAYPKTARI